MDDKICAVSNMTDEILRKFRYDHLPEGMQELGREFYALAERMCKWLSERDETGCRDALTKLLAARKLAFEALLVPPAE